MSDNNERSIRILPFNGKKENWEKDGVVLEIINTTALRPHVQDICDRQAHIVAITEHSADDETAASIKKQSGLSG